MSEICAYSFEESGAGEETSSLQGWGCNQETYEGSDFCVFHLPEGERTNRDVESDTVTEALRTVAESSDPEEKQLIGARLGSIDLSREILRVADRHPLDLRHARISGTIELEEAEIQQPVNLRHASIGSLSWKEATFARQVDLSGVTVDGLADLSAATFEADVDFVDATFEGDVVAEETRFHGDTCFRDSEFQGSCSFDGIEFHGEANLLDDDACFERAFFADDVKFRMAKFRYADFVDCEFAGDVVFDEVTFRGDAEFSDAKFGGKASFRGAEFQGGADVIIDDADFEGAEFEGPADFENADFGYTDFNRTRFGSVVKFTDTVFNEDAVFDKSVFDETAKFDEARFRSDVSFVEVIIKGDGVFRGAEFHGGDNINDDDLTLADSTIHGLANFEQARFRYANFSSVSFEGGGNFIGAIFNGDAFFRDATFSGKANLEEVRFNDDALFDRTTFQDATFRGSEFKGGANVRVDDLSFKHAMVNGEFNFRQVSCKFATFEKGTFAGECMFDETSFEEEAVFDGVEFKGKVIFEECRFFDDANFANSTFGGAAQFNGVEFHGGDNVRDDDVTFENATFTDTVEFYRAEFEYANYSETLFKDVANFEAAIFNQEGYFENAKFQEDARFNECRFLTDADFQNVDFNGDAIFTGVEFEGGYHEDDDTAFNGATFAKTAAFDEIESRQTGFDNATFEGPVMLNESMFGYIHLKEAVFSDEVDLSYTKFEESASFEEVIFKDEVDARHSRFEDNACFVNSNFNKKAIFKGVEFIGGTHTADDADFEGAVFGDTANFEFSEFCYANFMNATFDGNVIFKETIFTDKARFDNAQFRGDSIFSRSIFEDRTNFSSCEFVGEAHFDEQQFCMETTFADASFSGDATFRASEFKGHANLHDDDASFKSTTFNGDANFEKSTFLYANFRDTKFGGQATFSEVTFENSVKLRPKPGDEACLVDLTDAVVNGGTIGQPETGNVYYDCTGGEIHDVTLDDSNCEHGLFDYFLFYNTDFSDFDFTAHKDYLARNNWIIHQLASDESLSGWGDEKTFEPAALENTYLKAKNCASDFGDRKAAAEFFIKEMHYRRKKCFQAAVTRDEEVEVGNRLKSLGKWFGNNVLHHTCGYGERLWRVVYVSAVVVLSWGILYATVTQGTTGSSKLTTQGIDSFAQLLTSEGLIILGKNMYFSMVTFTTLGYGDIQPIGATARTLAGLEAFVGALLVALVVFVLGRRVAW
jgi:uncharacterized protein YjbI with pentapeptide repeats